MSDQQQETNKDMPTHRNIRVYVVVEFEIPREAEPLLDAVGNTIGFELEGKELVPVVGFTERLAYDGVAHGSAPMYITDDDFHALGIELYNYVDTEIEELP